MTDLIPLNSLRYFVKVADVGSFTAAARELGISQPSLSVAIKKLEETLGTTLVVRAHRGVSITRTGEVLLQHARHILRGLAIAQQEITDMEQTPRGAFTLGCHESLAGYALPRFMARFLAANPSIQLSLWNGNSRDVERAVVDREVDLGLVVNPQSYPDTVILPLFDDRVEVIISTQLKRKIKGEVHELFERFPLIFVPQIRQCQYIVAALAKEGHHPRSLTCSSMELVKNLVADGVGAGILPWRVATYGIAKGRLETLSPSLPSFDDRIALLRRYDMHMTQAARVLIDSLLEHGREMPPLAKRRG